VVCRLEMTESMKILGNVLIILSILYGFLAIIGLTIQWYLRSTEIKGFSWQNWQIDIFYDFLHFCPTIILFLLGKYIARKKYKL
jgi:hypothetical protein